MRCDAKLGLDLAGELVLAGGLITPPHLLRGTAWNFCTSRWFHVDFNVACSLLFGREEH